ncbi:Carboxypeptidase A1 [Purpureocillium lavendulum]|uniref:Carboxypeptidase A1 n=1 Tax=Purpureocillium lavendulum TaxID=1247861 RepID=A0AB34FWB3_9HYPO|nr:Carboxypeptidase A1 [Purpureocillium lavendulum]
MDAAPVSLYTLPTSPANWDRIGIFYICYACIWTTLVLSGMVFCWLNRHHPVLKIRGLPLSFTAIAFLHAYWILAQITYPIGRTIPTILAYDIQYFFMGIWFPLGIALFHASNSRFLHIAKLQKQFTHPELRFRAGCDGAKSSWLCRLRNMRYTRRIMIFIGFGMVLQVLLTVGMWLACKKYHPTYGIPGTDLHGATLPEQLEDLGRGWEWWPSVLWQVIWTWIVAPILIWRAWGIRDTMGWRTQTIGCCLSKYDAPLLSHTLIAKAADKTSLHATPMFLIASYVPAFRKVNPYFTPSQWIHLSIFMFEIFTVFVPVFQVIRLQLLSKKAQDSNAKWETGSQTTTLRSSTSADWQKTSSLNLVEKGQALDYLDETLGDRLLTMSALEHVLGENPGPLQEFSALCDFSGENIAFLTLLSIWQKSLSDAVEHETRLESYNRALEIYVDFVSPRDAEFPLNLSSSHLKPLQEVFEKAARIVCGEGRNDPVTPFDMDPRTTSRSLSNLVRYTGEIPEGFHSGIFDSIQSHVKYLVFTNTWPKFVEEMQQQRRRSSETGHSDFTTSSEKTLASRVSSQVSSFLSSLW